MAEEDEDVGERMVLKKAQLANERGEQKSFRSIQARVDKSKDHVWLN